MPVRSALPAVNSYYVYGYDLEVKDSVGPALLAVVIFFFTSLNTTIGFLRERLQGTLEKVLVSPLDRIELVSGYILAYMVLSVAQSAITFVILVLGFKVPNRWQFAGSLNHRLAAFRWLAELRCVSLELRHH